MCDVAERLEKMGIVKGIEIGRLEGKEEGKVEGKAEGKAEGKLQAKKEIVQSLAERGMNLGDIAEIIKVSQKTIQEWLDQK